MQAKKDYLKQYLIQGAIIRDAQEMLNINKVNSELYRETITNAEELRINIENSINSVGDCLIREILIEKYILGKTLEQIAFNLNYSVRQIERLHKKAIEKFAI